MRKIRSIVPVIAAIALVGTAGVTGVAASAAAAGASGAVLSTTNRTETLTSGKCYHEKQVTTTNFGYSSKAGHYVRYPAPKVTTTISTHCHK